MKNKMTKEEFEQANADLVKKAEKHLEENLSLYKSYSLDVKVNLCRILLDFTWKNINCFNDILHKMDWKSFIDGNDLLVENDVCSSCRKNQSNPLHMCPYKDDINNNQEQCNCCIKCTSDCAQEI